MQFGQYLFVITVYERVVIFFVKWI